MTSDDLTGVGGTRGEIDRASAGEEKLRATPSGDSSQPLTPQELRMLEMIDSTLYPIHRKLDSIEQRLSAMEQQLNTIPTNQEVEQEAIPLSNVSREQAKAAIEELINNATGVLYYSKIAEKLDIDLGLVISICDELLEEGKIKYEDEGAQTNTRTSESNPWVEFEGTFAVDPHFDDFLRAVEKYREKWDDEEINNG